QPLAWDPELLAPGLSRVQARVDRFSGEGAGTRMLYVREPGESDGFVLRKLARQAAEEGFGSVTDGWAKELPSWADADLQRTAAYAPAPLGAQGAGVPPAVSGRPTQVARVAPAKKLARFGVSPLLVVAALFVGVSLMRRGLHASEEASAILAEAS